MTLRVIYNPIAGRARVQALWPQIEIALHHAGVDFEAVATRGPLDATELARSAAGRYTGVVGIGGDGTLSEVVNGLLMASGEGETLPLGVVPLGNGDDFAKVLPPQAPIGGSCYDWKEAVRKIARGESRLYDAGRLRADAPAPGRRACSSYFVNVVDVGFGAHTVANFAAVPTVLSGHAAYLAAILKTMVNYPTLALRIQLDDAPAFEQVTTITAIGNGRSFGSGLWVCPDAAADDGEFDVMIADEINRRAILRLLPQLRRGTHGADPRVKMQRARRIVLEASEPFFVEADGEMPFSPTRRLEIEALPGRLRVYV